ncbi:MAG: prefoldin subunit alpha [Nanoarchaeota archaeon]|nr:prefoldin subunit alpha [Nanoarchaeota archaeon]
MDKKTQQELIFKFSMYEQQIKQLQEQLQAVEQAINDASSLAGGLDELNSGKDKEILASIGKGIFAKAKLISDELVVDVGGKNFVTKSIEDTQTLIVEQVDKLDDIKKELERNLEEINQELTKTFMEAQGKEQ